MTATAQVVNSNLVGHAKPLNRRLTFVKKTWHCGKTNKVNGHSMLEKGAKPRHMMTNNTRQNAQSIRILISSPHSIRGRGTCLTPANFWFPITKCCTLCAQNPFCLLVMGEQPAPKRLLVGSWAPTRGNACSTSVVSTEGTVCVRGWLRRQ